MLSGKKKGSEISDIKYKKKWIEPSCEYDYQQDLYVHSLK